MHRLSKLVACLSLLLAAACGANRAADPAPGQPTGKAKGQIRISTNLTARSAAPTAPPAVCGDFELTPYGYDSSGNPVAAGSPITLHSSATASTDAILGCVDGAGGAGGFNWGYWVTATNFHYCTAGAGTGAIYPASFAGSYPVACKAGVDVPLAIAVDVSIPVANAGGYIDITVGTNATAVQTGCKEADYGVPAGPALHFGESQFDAAGGIAQGLVAFDQVNASGAVHQFGGSVTAGGVRDTYYTGTNDPAQTGTGLIYQTFVQSCPGAEYVGTAQAQCLTTPKPPTVTTAGLADAFLASANGYVAASVASATTLQLYWASGAPTLMDANFTPAHLGYNGLNASQLAAPAGISFTGLFIDQSAADTLLVTGSSAAGAVWATLTYSAAASGWVLGAFSPVGDLSGADLACHGLFAQPKRGCFTPKPCAAPVVQRDVCLPPAGVAMGWTDHTGAPTAIPVGDAAAGRTFGCRLYRAAAEPPSSFTPCDGATGATPFLKLPAVDAAASAANYYYRDGMYSYDVQVTDGGVAGAITTTKQYFSTTLNGLCSCPQPLTLAAVLARAEAGEFDGTGLNSTLQFGAATAVEAPFITLEFDPAVAGKGGILNFLTGNVLADHGYFEGRGSPRPKVCGNLVTQNSLRHEFKVSANKHLVGSRRVYQQRQSFDWFAPTPGAAPVLTRSCFNNRDTGALYLGNPLFPDYQWARPAPEAYGRRATPHYVSMKNPLVETPKDIGAEYEIFDPHGTAIYLNQDATGHLVVTRKVENIQCREGTSVRSDGALLNPAEAGTACAYDNTCGGGSCVSGVCQGVAKVTSSLHTFFSWKKRANPPAFAAGRVPVLADDMIFLPE